MCGRRGGVSVRIVCSIILQDLFPCSYGTRGLGQFLVQRCDTLKASCVLVCIRPLDKQHFALLPDLCVSNIVASKDSKSLKKWFVCESTLEARSGILYQTI